MKKPLKLRLVPGALLALAGALAGGPAHQTEAALVTVNTTETWDGTTNPHAADGVTVSGAGTDADPYTYTIPDGMVITSTGRVILHSAGDHHLKFVLPGGDLRMEPGAILNTERYGIRSGLRTFVLDLGGVNSITGAGNIGPITTRDSTLRSLTIQNVRHVRLANIDMHVENANTGPADFRAISITASGDVVITGNLDNADRDTGGDGAGDITIKAATIDVNHVDARGFRNDPSGRPPYSGNVLLQALAPAGNYDPNAIANTAANRLTIRGAIRTMATDARTIGGSVTLQAVAQTLVAGVINVPPDATKTLEVGELRGGATAGDLFANVAGAAETAANVVKWSGTFTPLPGSGPAFTADPVTLPEATAGAAYSRSLAGSATDPDGNPLVFAKLAGPAWLSISPEGLATGTPALTDSCLNTFQISVSDGTRFDLATLNIFVAAGPRWNDGNDDFFYAPATQETPYTADLAANVIYCGPQALTYAKVSGPDWLNVAPNGALSGTPNRTNVLENVWVVTVSDGASTNDAILRILVAGSPRFISSPVQAGNARAGVAYGSSTLLGTAVDPQNQPLTFAKVASGGPGPDWLTVSPDGALSGVPGAANLGTNTWTISASNGAFPATLNTLRVVVLPGGISGPVQVVSREYWDGVENPHAVDGVTLSGAGTADDPATYLVPRGLVLSANGQIYTSKPTGPNSQQDGTAPEALHIRIQVDGNLEMAGNNNAFVIAVHARNSGIGQKNLALDLNGNSLLGQGRIVGLGNRVDPVLFPDCFDRDTPRILTITNARDVSLFDINVQTRDANNWGRPLNITASGTVQVATGIDNSDRDGGGDGGNDVSVTARTIAVGTVRTDSARTGGFRNVGKISLRALAAPGYSATDGANNSSNNWIRVTGNLRASTPQDPGTWGAIATESVVLEFGPDAAVNAGAISPVTPADKLSWNVGLIKNGAAATDLLRNQSAGVFTASHTVDWSGRVPSAVPPSPTLLLGASTPGQVVLSWTGAGFVLQQNPDLHNPAGWVNAPSGTANPATNAIGTGNLFFRLRWP